MAGRIALAAIAIGGIWMLGNAAIHRSQGAGLDGVYIDEGGGDQLTFWTNGTYLLSGAGLYIPGKYRVRPNGTVDMAAQFDSTQNPSQQDPPTDALLSTFARSIDGEVSTDKNTFHWQGNVYSYDHSPTTGPPVVPDPNSTQAGSQQSGTVGQGSDPQNQMQAPTAQQLNQTLPQSGDQFHVNTDPDPSLTDPNQIGQQTENQSDWGTNSPKMQQYYQAHPNMAPQNAQIAPSNMPTATDPAAPMPAPPGAAPPTGVIMPDSSDIQGELNRLKN